MSTITISVSKEEEGIATLARAVALAQDLAGVEGMRVEVAGEITITATYEPEVTVPGVE